MNHLWARGDRNPWTNRLRRTGARTGRSPARGLTVGLALVLAGLSGCTGGGGDGDGADDAGPDGQLVDGAMPDFDMPDAEIDAEPIPDAAPPPVCFEEGGDLVEASISDPYFGLEGLRADVDPDGDGRVDLLLRRQGNDGVYLEFADGRTLEPGGSYAALGAIDARLMPGLWPAEALVTPLDIGGTAEWLIHEVRAADQRLVRVDAADLTATEVYPLPAGAVRVQTVRSERPVALIDLDDGGCLARALMPAGPEAQWGLCRLTAVPDVNGDGNPDILRYGAAGLEIFDGVLLESIAFAPDIDVEAATDTPTDLRGMGPELASVSIEDGGALVARYHDPIELRVVAGPETLRPTGIYTRLRFVTDGTVVRIAAELDRNGQYFLHLIEPGRELRRLGEYGPFQVMRWSMPGDIDGDGLRDIQLRGGSTDDGTNTDVVYLRLRDGATIYEIESERAARFDPIWNNALPPAPADLDGCEGFDRVLLRSGPPREGGVRATRVHFLDTEGRLRTRSDPYDGRVHALTIADLDGEPPAELLEIRSENADAARLRVFTPLR